MSSSAKKLDKLEELAEAGGLNIFTRVKLAYEVLEDVDFIAERFGDEIQAIEEMEKAYFRDLRGYVTLGRLRQLYAAYPDPGVWSGLGYDLAAVEAKYSQEHAVKSSSPASRNDWKKTVRTQDEQLASLRAEIADLKAAKKQLVAENKKLVAANKKLEDENKRLKARLEKLAPRTSRPSSRKRVASKAKR